MCDEKEKRKMEEWLKTTDPCFKEFVRIVKQEGKRLRENGYMLKISYPPLDIIIVKVEEE